MHLNSWLIAHGLIPNKDFFDNHEFLFTYLLAPFSVFHSFLPLYIVHYTLLTINLLLTLTVLKKITSKVGFVLAGSIFVLFAFFLIGRVLWYESFIATLYL